MRLIFRVFWFVVYPILKLLGPRIQRWVKPTYQSLVLGAVADLTRGRSELVLENAFLRQQVIVLSREKKRTPLTNRDRRLLVDIQVSKRTIQKYLKRIPRLRPTGQTWSTFVRNHAADIWACALRRLTMCSSGRSSYS
jgi:hypothetical protein